MLSLIRAASVWYFEMIHESLIRTARTVLARWFVRGSMKLRMTWSLGS